MMSHDEAVNLVMKRCRNTRLYNLLINWDETKTLTENALKLGVSYVTALSFRNRYGLKCAYSPRWLNRTPPKVRDWYIKKWDSNKTISENAKRLKVSLNMARTIANNYGLSWTKVYKSGMRQLFDPALRQASIRMAMLALKEKGMSLAEIGRVYNLSRERVRQIIL